MLQNNFYDPIPAVPYLSDFYTIYYKNACFSVTFQLWIISGHCLGLKNKSFDIQNPLLATLNMILHKEIGQMTHRNI